MTYSYVLLDKITKKINNIIIWDGNTYLDPDLQKYNDFICVYDNEYGTRKDCPITLNHTYNEEYNMFVPPPPPNYPSFVFDYEKWMYKPPIPYPNDGLKYVWDESTTSWLQK